MFFCSTMTRQHFPKPQLWIYEVWSKFAPAILYSSETVASTRGIKYNSAILVMQDRLAKGLGHLFPLQGFWFYAHPDSDTPRTHKHPGMQYPRQVTNWEADQSLEHSQHSLLNKLDQMKTYFRIGKWQDYSRLIILQREQFKQAPWFFMLKLGRGSIFPLAHQEGKVSYIFSNGNVQNQRCHCKNIKTQAALIQVSVFFRLFKSPGARE